MSGIGLRFQMGWSMSDVIPRGNSVKENSPPTLAGRERRWSFLTSSVSFNLPPLIHDGGLDGGFLRFFPRMTWLRMSLRFGSTDCLVWVVMINCIDSSAGVDFSIVTALSYVNGLVRDSYLCCVEGVEGIIADEEVRKTEGQT